MLHLAQVPDEPVLEARPVAAWADHGGWRDSESNSDSLGGRAIMGDPHTSTAKVTTPCNAFAATPCRNSNRHGGGE